MTSDTTGRRPTKPVPRYARIDVIGGAAMMFLAGLVWVGAIGLETGSLTNLGPGALPDVLAVTLGVAGTALLVRGMRQPADQAERFEFAIRPTAIVVLAIVLFGMFIRGGQFGPASTPQLGLALVGPLTVFVAGCASPEPRLKDLVVLALGLTGLMLFLFVDLLNVGIPVFPASIQRAIPQTMGADAALRVIYCLYGALAAALYACFFVLPENRRG